jgi:pimeloyl-ACP methyl ester carboxylesterase
VDEPRLCDRTRRGHADANADDRPDDGWTPKRGQVAPLVGVSAGGAIAQLIALDYPERVLSLVLISTSPALPIGRSLPPPTSAFGEFFARPTIDWSDPESVIDYRARYTLMLAGHERRLDEGQVRDLIRRDLERDRDFAAAKNHDLLSEDDRAHEPLSSITAPTLVIHGTADPLFRSSTAAHLPK